MALNSIAGRACPGKCDGTRNQPRKELTQRQTHRHRVKLDVTLVSPSASGQSPSRGTGSARTYQRQSHEEGASRRALLFAGVSLLAVAPGQSACAAGIEVLEDVPGFGSRGARRGDLLLFHYVGRLESTGQVFDSTRGGLAYRDGGPGVLRPAAVALGSGPVPGICEGLQEALEGMSIGGKRTVRVPAALGFGGATVLAPYAVVPGGSTLLYEVELLRLSASGPDQLTKGIVKCGAGGANQQSENCGTISYAEFL